MKTPFFKLSVLTLALAAGYAQAEDLPAEHKQELQNITVKGDISTRRVTTKKMDESTSTDMKDVLFNEPSINFGGGNATSQWVSIRGMGQDQIDMKVDDTYSDSQIFHHNGRFLLDPSLVKVVGVQKAPARHRRALAQPAARLSPKPWMPPICCATGKTWASK